MRVAICAGASDLIAAGNIPGMGPVMLSAKVIAFDAYGTLCHITSRVHPYRMLSESCSVPIPVLRHALMTNPGGLEFLAEKFEIGTIELRKVNDLIQQEINSVRLFPEVTNTLHTLKMQGFKLAILSNLACPYAQPIQEHFSTIVDLLIFSFEVGAIKPHPRIFQILCEKLAIAPYLAVMVGDSLSSDIQGARDFGIHAIHLDRSIERKEEEKQNRCISDIGMILSLVKSCS